MKKCSMCGLEKDDVGKSGKCKQCNTEYMRQYREKNKDKIKKYQREYDATYYQENKEEILTYKKDHYEENKEEKLEKQKEYYQEHKEERQEYNKIYYQENKEDILKQDKEYRIKNADKIRKYQNEYTKERRINDPNFRIRTSVSANINFYLKSNDSSKNGYSCLDYLPYSIQELKEHLEKQFEPWMSWDNYGKYNPKTWDDNASSTWTWQIDHIIPQSLFDYTSMDDEKFMRCWSLNNLRPLSSKQNFLEGINRTRHR